MKRKSIIAIAAALCICCNLAGCGESSAAPENSVASDSAASESVAAEESAADDDVPVEEVEMVELESEAEAEEPAAPEYAPKQEIIDAAYNSGYIQICDDIFRNGGYLTVNDFVKQYGENWALPDDFDASAIMGGEMYFLIATNTKSDIERQIEMLCYAPNGDECTKGDAIIIKYQSENNVTDCRWLPGGYIASEGDYTMEDIIAYWEANGFTANDKELSAESIPKADPTKYAGTYRFEPIECRENNMHNMENVTAVVEMPDENLFGVKPVMALVYTRMDNVDVDATMDSMRERALAREDGDVESDEMEIIKADDNRHSSCSYGSIYYAEKAVRS